jgi:hypothetical protein
MMFTDTILDALRKVALVAALCVFVPLSANAKTLYVDGASGNDSTTWANNSASSPWRTIGRAAWGSTSRTSPNPNEAARAGDTVIVRAGTYAGQATGQRYEPTYNVVNQGTAGNPIVFQAEGLVQLTHTGTLGGPAIGVYNRDYVTWRGFTVDEATARAQGDSGPAVIWYSNGSSIEDCDIDGNGNPGWNDNHTGIRIVESTNVVVRNNRVTSLQTSEIQNAANGSAIQVYYSGAVLIEHNELLDSGSGIFLKAPYGPNLSWYTIRYNLIRDMDDSGIAIHRSPNTASAPILIYQNIVINTNSSPLKIWSFDPSGGSTEPMNAKFVNNTVYNGTEGVRVSGNLVPNAGHVFWNNVIWGGQNYAVNFGGDASHFVKSRIDFEHNLYWSFGNFALVYTNGHTLSTWKSQLGQDNASPAGINQNPMFVNAAGNDFRLQSGSPARTLGVDRLDLNNNGSTTDIIPAGAYITGNEVIGRTSGGSNPTAPMAPTGLRIVP